MPRETPKPADVNRDAWRVVQQATQAARDSPHKNPAAVTLGRLGGLKGGVARAATLTPARRKAIAKKAAMARWNGTTRSR